MIQLAATAPVASAAAVPAASPAPIAERVAIVHDWFTLLGGAEKVVASLIDVCPNSEIFTVFANPGAELDEILRGRPLHVSSLNRWPLVARYYRHLLLLAMRKVEAFDVSAFGAVISSSAAIGKGVITRPGQPHIAYVHSPARYAWDLSHEYLKAYRPRGLRAMLAREVQHRFRNWDARTTNGVDVLVANSDFVRRRIWKIYRRRAEVVYPPVDVHRFNIQRRSPDHFVTAGRLVGYKRVDLIVDAFATRPELKLVVVGDGPELSRLKRRATPNVTFTGRVPTPALLDLYANARAFVFAALEDFGMAPVEAQAAGLPVIALGAGGALETVVDASAGKAATGIHFAEQTVASLLDCLDRFLAREASFDQSAARANAARFAAASFRARMTAIVGNALARRSEDFDS